VPYLRKHQEGDFLLHAARRVVARSSQGEDPYPIVSRLEEIVESLQAQWRPAPSSNAPFGPAAVAADTRAAGWQGETGERG
jgi:hypothetical protein